MDFACCLGAACAGVVDNSFIIHAPCQLLLIPGNIGAGDPHI